MKLEATPSGRLNHLDTTKSLRQRHNHTIPRVCVTKVKDQDVFNAVKSCFDEIAVNGLLERVKRGLIKPNFVAGLPASSGTTTDLRIVEALIKILRENEVEVIVGESSLEDTGEVFKALNVFELEKLGAKIVNFDEGGWVMVESPTKLALKRFRLPEVVLNSDLIISAAKMKVHDQTGVTLSMKNLLGMIPKIDRKTAHKIDIDKAIVDVYAYPERNKKVISFVDGIYAMEGKGSPTRGKPVEMDLIVAGDNVMATDMTCIEIMGLGVKQVKHLSISEKIGLGNIRGREVVGEDVAGIKRRFEIPPSVSSPKPFLASYVIKRFFKRKPVFKYEERCIQCKLCVENCPIGNIRLEGDKIEISKKGCIGCMVCLESCKEGALDYEIDNVELYKIMRSIYHKLKM